MPDSARSTAEAAALERELLDEYRFGRQQLVELCGHASAVAVTKVPAPLLGLTANSTQVGKLRYQGAHRPTRQKWGPQRPGWERRL